MTMFVPGDVVRHETRGLAVVERSRGDSYIIRDKLDRAHLVHFSKLTKGA